MPYEEHMTRENPSAILFLRDISDSMGEEFGGENSKTKAERLNTALNRQIANITIACAKSGEEVRDYFDVGVVEYQGGNVDSAWTGDLSGRDLVPVSDLKDNPLRVETRTVEKVDDAGQVREVETKFPVWFEPQNGSGTPMCEALKFSYDLLEPWVDQHQDSFPPLVINVTDGRATDGDPQPGAEKLQSLSTNDGNVVLFNIHISSVNHPPTIFPASKSQLPSEHSAREHSARLFEMSSPLPSVYQKGIQKKGYEVTSDSRGYVFHAGAVEMVQTIQALIGTPKKQIKGKVTPPNEGKL